MRKAFLAVTPISGSVSELVILLGIAIASLRLASLLYAKVFSCVYILIPWIGGSTNTSSHFSTKSSLQVHDQDSPERQGLNDILGLARKNTILEDVPYGHEL